MATGLRSQGAARSIISVGHLLVGGAAFVFAGVMIVAGSNPRAELVMMLERAGFTEVDVRGEYNDLAPTADDSFLVYVATRT